MRADSNNRSGLLYAANQAIGCAMC